MKARMIQRSLAVAAFAAIALAADAQKEHQTYNGPFGLNNVGTATYSYYVGDDGRRMFDGKYTYKRTDSRNGGSTYTETGQYKDDKLEGLWTLNFNGSLFGNKVVAKITLNYKDGLLHGPMDFTLRETEDGKTTTKQYTILFHEGNLTGKNTKILLDMKEFSYEFDDQHQPNGLWTCRLNRPSEQFVQCLRYDHGKMVENYYENLSTGDRGGQRKDVIQVGYPLLEEICKLLQQPYGYKEMPARSSVTEQQRVTQHYDKGCKFGFLSYQGYGQQWEY